METIVNTMKKEQVLHILDKNETTGNSSIMQLFPAHLRRLFGVCRFCFESLQEIRLRAGQPVILIMDGKENFLQRDGSLKEEIQNAHRISSFDITDILNHICNYSIYAFEDEIRQGFISVPGGHRVGLAGQAVMERPDAIRYLKHIHYLNIRIAHQKLGVADKVLPHIYRKSGVYNTLIMSPPGCGKTTLLRDLIRQISDGNEWGRGCEVSVIDERSEIAGSFQGVPQNDVGIRTDVLDACPKLLGMMMVIRSMAPKVLAVDELGNGEEMELLRQAQASGCRVLATIHAQNLQDMAGKEFMKKAFDYGIFERYIVLEKKNGIPTIEGIYDEGMSRC